MNNLYSIGDVAKIKDITIKALRYYHKMGILIPSYIDEKSGYRYYSLEQFVYIDIIKGCRALGTSIEELQNIFKDCDTNTLIEFLQNKRKEAEENILKMKEIIKNIDDLSNNINTAKILANKDEVNLENLQKRKILVVPCREPGELREVLYYSDLDKLAKEKGIELSMERGLLYQLNPQGELEPRYAFSTFHSDNEVKASEHIKILPAGNYLTLAYTKDNEEHRMKNLMEYIEVNQFKINFLLEVELFNDLFNTNSYSCQLQIHIQ